MKQTDIATIILVAGFSLIISFVIGNAVINTDENRSTDVEVVAPFDPVFVEPTNNVFNQDTAINAVEDIQIGDSQVDKPFVEANN